MNEQAIEILNEILLQLKCRNSDRRLWTVADIADYLGLSESTVRTRIICKKDFPAAISINTDTGSTNRRWYPGEVKEWIALHKENKTIRRGRPRANPAATLSL